MSDNNIDLMNLPDDLIELKSLLFITGINYRAKKSIEYIHNNYHQYERLKLALSFIEYHFTDAIKSDINQLATVGFFPSTEAQIELDYSIKHAIIGSYKASFADLRRSLELTLTSIFLVSEHFDRDNAIKWVLSQQNTPFFSTMIEKLIKTDRFKNINDNYNWKDVIKKFYWKISDFAHTKGQLKGYRELNKLNFFISGTSAPNIDYDTLKEFLDCYIGIVEHIVTILSLYNPIILIGLPLDEKFGINGFLEWITTTCSTNSVDFSASQPFVCPEKKKVKIKK